MKKTKAAVFFGEACVGTVNERTPGSISFVYDDVWLKNSGRFAISSSLPLQTGIFQDKAHFFFANLLPEGDVRIAIAERLGISSENDFDLLLALGGDCAGALTIGHEPVPVGENYTVLNPKELRKRFEAGEYLLSSLQDAPEGDVRLSLAGAQDKVPVYLVNGLGALFLPHGNSPSSHILKLPSLRFKHLAENECLMSLFAQEMQLKVAKAELYNLGGINACLVERYDRVQNGNQIRRLHQEDFCQALGFSPRAKYEKNGGPGFDRIYEQIEILSSRLPDDHERSLRWLIFNVLGGNCDAHAKNLSLLMRTPGQWNLTPHYDLVCTKMYPRLSKDLAMSIGGTFDSGTVTGTHWDAFAKIIKVRASLVREFLGEMIEMAPAAFTSAKRQFTEQYGKNEALQLIEKIVHEQTRRLKSQLLK